VIFDGGDETPGLTVNFCYQNKRRKTRPSDLHEEVRFASDSSLEGNEFEPLVPGAKRAGFGGEGELRVRNGVSITGYRWFESISLQRRVHCELAPHGFGAPVIGQQLALRGEAISPSGPAY
jgi:hypothetical protein